MNIVYLLTGGNMRERETYLAMAQEMTEKLVGTVLKCSHIYETAAWGITDQQPFLNQVLQVHTAFTAQEVLQQILNIETTLGRTRSVKFGPRLIDIDILFFNSEVILDKNLKIPHPEIPNRRFALVPLNEIAADHEHPTLFKKVSTLLNDCTDPLPVSLFS